MLLDSYIGNSPASVSILTPVMNSEAYTASDGQTAINIINPYTPGTNSVLLFINGVKMVVGVDYTETNSTLLTMTYGLGVGDQIQIITGVQLNNIYGSGALVTYTPAGGTAVASNVQSKLRELISVKDFGAVGDGVTNDTTAIQNAISYLVSVGGGILYFPTGQYRCNTNLSVTGSNIRLLGAGRGASRINFYSTSGTCLDFSGAIGLCGLEDIALYTINATSGKLVAANNITRFLVQGVLLNGAPAGSNLANTLLDIVGANAVIVNSIFYGATTLGIGLTNGSNYFLHNVDVDMNGITGAALSITTSTVSTIVSSSIFRKGNFSVITGTSTCTFIGTHFDQPLAAMQVNSCSGVYFTAGSKFSNSGGAGLSVSTSSQVTIDNCQVFKNALDGIIFNNGCSEFSVKNCLIDGNNTGNTASRAGLNIFATCNNFSITGNRIGNITGSYNGHQKHGIFIQPGTSDHYIISDNNVLNNETTGITDSGTGINAKIRGNDGYNPVGISSVTVPASTVSYRAGHNSETLYIRGGTVTAIKIPDNTGQTIFTSTPCTVHLDPGETMSITYSVVPTVFKHVH
jgi:hypothetical protein